MNNKTYLCIDLKSFFASVECVERGLDPLCTNLVVADESRTEKTICLAVTPSLKAYGLSGRSRLFEVVQKVRDVNRQRRHVIRGRQFSGKSYDANELCKNLNLELDYIVAPPRMAYYMAYSTKIYDIYLKYIAPEDIHVYSIDEVFIDITSYLSTYKLTPKELAMKIIRDVLKETGITATAGIGTNMYLAKIAMDIVAKKMKPDENGVRIASLDEMSYRKELWTHRPLTDFWRIGKGISKKLESNGIYTMGDIARISLFPQGEDKLYKLFGINAELIIDHAWGYEPCTIDDIRSYKPENKSISSGQVLHCPYDFEKARLIVQEMTHLLSLDLVRKGLLTDQIVLTVGYDIENLEKGSSYGGEVVQDFYGRSVPKHAHGTENLSEHTSSSYLLQDAALSIFDRTVQRNLTVRRLNLCANHIIEEKDKKEKESYVQLDFFTDYDKKEKEDKKRKTALEKERKILKTTVELQERFGKNAILKGFNLKDGATTKDRNSQIGGHKA
ncbi:MAG: DNA methylase [Ruminococcaceae bacterium]|nr:DNA methylase [Oscillospiraceae bacterium]